MSMVRSLYHEDLFLKDCGDCVSGRLQPLRALATEWCASLLALEMLHTRKEHSYLHRLWDNQLSSP